MLDKLITASTNYLIRQQVIDEVDRDVYDYGFHSLYNNIIDLASIIIIAVWLRQVPQTILYHLSFIVIRQTAGGFHAKTHLRCFVISTIIWMFSLWGISLTSSSIIYIALAGLSVMLIWMKAPIEHVNSPLDSEKYMRMKLLSKLLSFTFFVIIIILTFEMEKAHTWITASLAYGMASHSLLMLISLYKTHT